MDTLEVLENEETKTLSIISKAANEGNASLVLLESEKLEKIKNLIAREYQILSEVKELKNGNLITPPQKSRRSTTGLLSKSRSLKTISSRRLGEKIRNEFLNKREVGGIHLQRIKGKTIFRTQSGKRVGIAVATERQPNKWFLGLPVDGFDHAVLLCQRESGEVIEVPLPERFFTKYGDKMSRSNGQLKFNVIDRGDGLLIQVPDTDGIKRKYFENDYSFLL